MQSLTISNSRDVVVEGLRSVDSEMFHVVVIQCRGVTLRGVTVQAPADSPNTDGIHIHMSSHVAVYDARVSTGDDCVSIGPGNEHLWIERVACGPGHGIRYCTTVRTRESHVADWWKWTGTCWALVARSCSMTQHGLHTSYCCGGVVPNLCFNYAASVAWASRKACRWRWCRT
jgi:polygalacturonase